MNDLSQTHSPHKLQPHANASASARGSRACASLELRQYTLQAGQRDVLIALFEREFIEPQEALGILVPGLFRDLDVPDRFVWLRGFGDIATRHVALGDFYSGPVWQTHRMAANATMIDSDNVLWLKPTWPGAALQSPLTARAPVGATQVPRGCVCACVFQRPTVSGAALDLLDLNAFLKAGSDSAPQLLGCYESETSANKFPRLPVREGESVIVLLLLFANVAKCDEFLARASWATPNQVPTTTRRDSNPLCAAPLQVLRLLPTPRSALHAGCGGI